MYSSLITLLFLIPPSVSDSSLDSIFALIQQEEYGPSIEKAIKSLLSGDENKRILDAQDPGTGQTPIMMSTLMGKRKIVKLLLEYGPDMTIAEKDGYTPMHGAGFQGRAKVAKLLIEKGKLNPSDRHSDGYTPLHRACWGDEPRHADTVRVLLRHGVPHDEKASNGKTCMDMTKNEKTKKVIEKFLAKLEKEKEL